LIDVSETTLWANRMRICCFEYNNMWHKIIF
jgi:hypothetical protein